MSTPEIPDIIRLAVRKAAEAAFFTQTSAIEVVGNGAEFAVTADISQPVRRLGEKAVWYSVKFLIPGTFPNDVVNCIPLKPALRWYSHQNGDWPPGLCWHPNIICPPTLSQVNPAELLQPYITHAHEWITDARQNKLANDGQRFELPHIVPTSKKKEIVYAEGGPHAFDFARAHRHGLARLYRRKKEPTVLRVGNIEDSDDHVLKARIARDVFGDEEYVGWIPWVYAGSPIVQGPRRPPLSFLDFTEEVQEHLVRAVDHAAGQKLAYDLLLLAFAVPPRWREKPDAIRWQAVELDDIKKENLKTPKNGFRKGTLLQTPGVRSFIVKNRQMRYMTTREISVDALTARAAEPNPLHKQSVTIIGVGALGSIISRAVGKLNPGQLVLIDNQVLEPGNLVRHEGMPVHVEISKAVSAAVLAAPIEEGALVDPVKADIVATWEKNRPETADLIIDATGDPGAHDLVFKDTALGARALAFVTPGPSFGVLLFCPRGVAFEPRVVHDRVHALLDDGDRALFDSEVDVAPEAGCHHPTFPAPYHRLRLMADSMLATILASLRADVAKPILTVYAQREKKLGFDTIILQQIEC